MDMENINGPIFFDFVNENTACGDSFFDVNPETAEVKGKKYENRRPVYKFSSLALSKPVVPRPERRRNVQPGPDKTKPVAKLRSVAGNRGVKVQPVTKPVLPVRAVPPKQPPQIKLAQNNKAVKRTVPFAIPEPAKRAKKITLATTPECLRRSQNKAKAAKTTEDLEMEHINQLQKEMSRHIKSNQATLKKFAQGPAIRPLSVAHNFSVKSTKPSTSGQQTRTATVARLSQPKVNFRAPIISKKKAVAKPENISTLQTPLCTSTPHILKLRPAPTEVKPRQAAEYVAKSKKNTAGVNIKVPVAHAGLVLTQHKAVPVKPFEMKVKSKKNTTTGNVKASMPSLNKQVQVSLLQKKVADAKENVPESPFSITACSVQLEKLTLEDVERMSSPVRKTPLKKSIREPVTPLNDITGSLGNQASRRRSIRLLNKSMGKKNDFSTLGNISALKTPRSQLIVDTQPRMSREKTYTK